METRRSPAERSREPGGSLLVIDDDPFVLKAVARMLEPAGYALQMAASGAEAVAALEAAPAGRIDVVLTDLHLPDLSGIELLSVARTHHAEVVTIVMTARASVASAVEAMRCGAFDYLLKPFSPPDILVSAVERAMTHKRLLDSNRLLEERLVRSERFEDLVGTSVPMRRLTSLIDTVGPTDASVLVTGESGTGKELVVRAIHARSRRRERPLVSINCGAFTESLLESELFGHERGAFTGAHARRKGLFEEADGGTMFLDEVGELPPSVQVRLLRVLQEREVRPVGANAPRPVDLRVVAATHRDLAAEVAGRRFRQDLFFRLNVVSLSVPALRERLDDLPLLVDHFLQKHSSRHGRALRRLDADGMALLRAHAWPGNVRELENTIERAIVLSQREALSREELEMTLAASPAAPAPPTVDAHALPLTEAKRAFEREYLVSLMAAKGGSVAETARHAGVDRSNFRRLLQRHGLGAR